MAATWTGTVFNTAGTYANPYVYKDVTFTAAAGDMLIAIGINEAGLGAGTTATQSGTTSAWTTMYSDGAGQSDCGFHSAWATCTTGGTLTVRVSVRSYGTGTLNMGAGILVIPAAEYTGTPSYSNSGMSQLSPVKSVTLSAISFVLSAFGGWDAAGAPSGVTPAGGTVDAAGNLNLYYDWYVAHWSDQASGTRNYGPSSFSGDTWIGATITLEGASAGGALVTPPTVAAVAAIPAPTGYGEASSPVDSTPANAGAASDLGGGSGTWATPSNATGATDTTYAVWTAP